MTKSGYFRVGLFAFAGTALVVSMLAILGAGSVFRRYEYAETYFDQSVQGLSVGSPVLYRGVPLGSVAEIGLCQRKYGSEGRLTPEEAVYNRYVYVKLRIDPASNSRAGIRQAMTELDSAIDAGFRVRLAAQGITGISVLEADYVNPEENPVLQFDWEPEHLYIPSASSTMVRIEEAIVAVSEIARKLRRIDYEAMGESLNEILAGVETLIESVDTESFREDLSGILADAREVTEQIRTIVADPAVTGFPERAGGILGHVERSVAELEGMISDLRPLGSDIGDELQTASEGMNRVVEQLDTLLASEGVAEAVEDLPGLVAQARSSLKRVNGILATNEGDLGAIVTDLQLVAANLRILTANARDYPSQVLFGEAPAKPGEKKGN